MIPWSEGSRIVFTMTNANQAGRSRAVSSTQKSVHERLVSVVGKHFREPWKKPLHAPSTIAFNRACELVGQELSGAPLIFDSGCGTGESTRVIAGEHAKCLVFGIDRSSHRLGKTGHLQFPHREGNIIWVRAELETFWRLAYEREWRLARHYLLYPNPYPNRSQLRKRWHAHPVFPVLLKLGGYIELRCNWQIYAQEFAQAIRIATGTEIPVATLEVGQALSAFERKYHASGHQLYRVSVPRDVSDGVT